MNIKECVLASFWYLQSALSLAFAHPCGNLFLSSWQLVWGTWKSQRQDLNGKKLLDPPCQGILMVTLPQCHYSEDQALSCLYCQKPCLKITPSQGIWYPQPRSESNGFQVFLLPCFSLSGQIMGQVIFVGVNVNCHSPLWYICSIHEYVCVCSKPGKIRGCRAVELLTSDSGRPFKLSSNHCVLLSGLPWRQTLWKPEQTFPRRAWLNV